jgi:hypothetical protein
MSGEFSQDGDLLKIAQEAKDRLQTGNKQSIQDDRINQRSNDNNQRPKSRTVRHSQPAAERVITSLQFKEDLGLTLERTHVGKIVLSEDPQKLLDTKYNDLIKLYAPLLSIVNRALNNIPVDDRHKLYNFNDQNELDRKSPKLDKDGNQMYSSSPLDKLRSDFDAILADESCVNALKAFSEALSKLRSESKFNSPEFKSESPYINKVRSAPEAPKAHGRGGRGR